MYSTVSTVNVPAFCLSGACPSCGQALTVRHTHQGRQPFVGCTGYPACRFTCQYDDAMQSLGQELQRLQSGWTPAYQHAQALTQQLQFVRGQRPQGMSPRVIDGELLALLTICHPDKWANSPIATELSKAVVALRQRVKAGTL